MEEEEEEVSAPVQCCPRDFLRRFGSGGGEEPREAKKGQPSEVEHSLRLSLGGCSGNEPNDGRTASVFPRRNALPEAAEQRRREELQSRKRKRSEKRERKGDVSDEAMEDGQRPSAAANGVVAPPLPPAALATKPRAGTVDGSKRFTPETQASVGSQGGGCPGVTDVNRGAKQGTGESHPTEAVAGRRVRGDGKEVERDVVQEMPCVSATGDGPNGRRVEGFLYRFRKDVRIVCVCHGRFFTPAEFVEHAGGGDVAHPLRRIVVNPFPSAFP